MGMRKRVRTKWKADRKEQIRKISAQRLKKATKAAAKATAKPAAKSTASKAEKKEEVKQAA